jgi:hypothetical protein
MLDWIKSPMFEFKFNGEDWKFRTAEIVVLMEHSRIFGNLSKSILVMVTNDKLSLMILSPVIQIYKNNWGQKAIVLRV